MKKFSSRFYSCISEYVYVHEYIMNIYEREKPEMKLKKLISSQKFHISFPRRRRRDPPPDDVSRYY